LSNIIEKREQTNLEDGNYYKNLLLTKGKTSVIINLDHMAMIGRSSLFSMPEERGRLVRAPGIKYVKQSVSLGERVAFNLAALNSDGCAR